MIDSAAVSRHPEGMDNVGGLPQERTSARDEAVPARAIIDRVLPQIEGGRFPIKRTLGDHVEVEAHLFTDGHDALSGDLLYRRAGASSWQRTPLVLRWNDEWLASFPVSELGRYEYTVEAWVDPYLGWSNDLRKRIAAGQDIAIELEIGAGLLREAAQHARKADRAALDKAAATVAGDGSIASRAEAALDPELVQLARRYPGKRRVVRYQRTLSVVVDIERARYSTWYELFPRSASPDPERHGTFADVEARLDGIKAMGFDVLYLPPIHPIGRTKRKGPNNATTANEGDLGSPWAIGGPEGGHRDIHPELGTLADFRHLVDAARERGIDIALDIAFQCSPDHPYVHEHPQWFKQRPDGTVQYAENPPKKYEDIYPFDFETEDWRALWAELKGVFEHWIAQGVRVFRVDNPHTKPFAFWEWCIGAIKAVHPEVIFLAEAFTRPKIMYRLAKLGFSQSYTYFAWRNERWDLTEYFTELTQTEAAEFFRPNVWPNTPDILTEYLQTSGRPGFLVRHLLAATLAASYGIYGPAFELMEHLPREHGSEEYLHSEKYQQRTWQLDRADSLAPFIAHVNRIRREHPALQRNDTLTFHATDNDQIIAYSKAGPDGEVILCAVNLDPVHTQSGWITLNPEAPGLAGRDLSAFTLHDLLVNTRYRWQGATNFVGLDPASGPGHVFRIDPESPVEHQ